MRRTIIGFMLVILALCQISIIQPTYAEQSKESQRISTIEHQVKTVSESVAEIRRDQLNYKIEKDLLKETYSSNVTTINLIITLILGAFAVFGYLGVKGIGALKADFNQELEKLRSVSKEFEDKIATVNHQIEAANSKAEAMAKVNVEQDRRLRILELQEKCGTWSNKKNYSRALEYANVGLELDDKDAIFLTVKSDCQMKMGSFKESCETLETYNNIYPGNISAIATLIEMSAIIGKIDQAQSLLKANEGGLVNEYGPYMSWYATALVLFFSGAFTELKAHLSSQSTPCVTDKACRIKETWSYVEALSVIERSPGRPGYKEIKSAIEFLQGSIGCADLNKIITGTV